MAELAIPMIALGSLWILSNQEKNERRNNLRENFENAGADPNALPNTNIPTTNFPFKTKTVNTIKKYPNANQATDKYFTQDVYEKDVNGTKIPQNMQQFVSLTGNQVSTSDFKHNNQTPYFGSKIRGAGPNANAGESRLDSMTGAGSLQVEKQEGAPLFKPQEQMSWQHGMPNMNDFMLSRQNPSMKMSNVKPWEEQRVAPGLNQGYNDQGKGGFNSGMMDRESWKPKTVDELRNTTNPKLTFELSGHEGPANSYIKERGQHGRVEKQLPDTFYLNTADRWFTTTGDQKGQTSRSVPVDRQVENRATTNKMHFNPAGDNKHTYTPQTYENSKRNVIDTNPMINLHVRDGQTAHPGDFGHKAGHNVLPNNRSTGQKETPFTNVKSLVSSAMAPIMDILRPSRKENVVGNLRLFGDAGSTVPHSYVNNPADRTETTIREQTENGSGHLSINRHGANGGGAYEVSKQAPTFGQRDTTNHDQMGGAGGGANSYGNQVYQSHFNQRNNNIKSSVINNKPNQGGMATFNGDLNMQVKKLESDRINNAELVPSGILPLSHGIDTAPVLSGNPYKNTQNAMNSDTSRLDQSLLNAFKNNPYTHSLSSAV